MTRTVPVIILTGHLGAGKTTVLNHLLRHPGVRIGVIINDFGAINVDAALVQGQIDEVASVSGGCLCCLADTSRLDEALDALSHPRLALDAIVIEASGLAEPGTLARLVWLSPARRIRLSSVVDVVDAKRHFDTVDLGGVPPRRYGVASLVVINRIDELTEPQRVEQVARIEARIRQRNPRATIIHTSHGRIDPYLLVDAAPIEPLAQPQQETLPLESGDGIGGPGSGAGGPDDDHPGDGSRRHGNGAAEQPGHEDGSHPQNGEPDAHNAHRHARSVSVTTGQHVQPDRIVDLLESPPPGAYRLKGTFTTKHPAGRRDYVVHAVGGGIGVELRPRNEIGGELVAIGIDLDEQETRRRLTEALAPSSGERNKDGNQERIHRTPTPDAITEDASDGTDKRRGANGDGRADGDEETGGGKGVGEGDTTGWERLGVYIRTPLSRSSTPLSAT